MRNSILSSSIACLSVAALVMQMLMLGVSASPGPAPHVAPGNPAFQRTWERTDQPVLTGAVSRTWMWGPEANTGVLQEDYSESPGGQRDVQYYDKSRMEITHPNAFDDGLWYVTNGLLVVEMMTGMMQVGDADFVPRAPAVVNVSGDADDPLGPTYLTFAGLRSAAPLADGATITQRVDRDGNVTNDPALASHGVTAAQRVTVPNIDHQIASPFWTFMTSSGLVHELGLTIQAPLFQNPFYATGYPLTEAYWANVEVAGTTRLVLAQCFERRCLTYTPGNPDGFVTEAGNVGQHYYSWRYDQPMAHSLVINEVMYWPETDGLEWLELHNPNAGEVDLTGWTLSNGLGTVVATLPTWTLPGGSYLVVWFGAGTNDADLTDGAGAYYTGAASQPFFTSADVALYDGSPAVDTIVDFVGWSHTDEITGGDAYADAVAGGIWPAGAAFDAASNGALIDADGPPHPLLATVDPGTSIGRDGDSSDTDTPDDWSSAGGADAAGPSPGAANIDVGPFAESSAELRQPQALALPLAEKPWTVMVYMDGRDGNVLPAWRYERYKMTESGSDANVNIVTQLMTGTTTDRHYIHATESEGWRIPTVDPGDPAALASFVTWAKTNFPAEKYAIVIAGHGNGWKGVLINRADEDFLTMAEVDTGLGALGEQFETVFFYACLMGMVEVGHQIADEAKYMVASQQIMWTGFPWNAWLDELKANPDWDGGELADEAAFEITKANEAIIFQPPSNPPNADIEAAKEGRKIYTIASIDLAELRNTLTPAVSALGAALRADVPEYHLHDIIADNDQLAIKHGALEPAKKMRDVNFLDLYHFAELVDTLLIDASALAQPVMDAVDAAVRFHNHGPGIANEDQDGLTIYFPHDLLLPSGAGACTLAGCTGGVAFAQPLFDPDELLATDGTHLYKQDANILVPKLLQTDHSMRDDPAFEFPDDTAWDEFLHRYYKPVADACIRLPGTCETEVTILVGETVTLSGNGSSDSDGPEGPSNDLPAHEPGHKHYYWDFVTTADHPDRKPNYLDNVLYVGCGQATIPPIDIDLDDCDRDDVDEVDDDIDAVGKLVDYTCAEEGSYQIRLMVWDEHHDQTRQSHEELSHNQGRHWLHFNVDDDWVIVNCEDPTPPPPPPVKTAPATAVPGDEIRYEIFLPANAELSAPATGTIIDQVPDAFFPEGSTEPIEVVVECTHGECFFNPETGRVLWVGILVPEESVTLAFIVTLPLPPATVPPSIVNCATVFDGVETSQVCATTFLLSGTNAFDSGDSAWSRQMTAW